MALELSSDQKRLAQEIWVTFDELYVTSADLIGDPNAWKIFVTLALLQRRSTTSKASTVTIEELPSESTDGWFDASAVNLPLRPLRLGVQLLGNLADLVPGGKYIASAGFSAIVFQYCGRLAAISTLPTALVPIAGPYAESAAVAMSSVLGALYVAIRGNRPLTGSDNTLLGRNENIFGNFDYFPPNSRAFSISKISTAIEGLISMQIMQFSAEALPAFAYGTLFQRGAISDKKVDMKDKWADYDRSQLHPTGVTFKEGLNDIDFPNNQKDPNSDRTLLKYSSGGIADEAKKLIRVLDRLKENIDTDIKVLKFIKNSINLVRRGNSRVAYDPDNIANKSDGDLQRFSPENWAKLQKMAVGDRTNVGRLGASETKDQCKARVNKKKISDDERAAELDNCIEGGNTNGLPEDVVNFYNAAALTQWGWKITDDQFELTNTGKAVLAYNEFIKRNFQEPFPYEYFKFAKYDESALNPVFPFNGGPPNDKDKIKNGYNDLYDELEELAKKNTGLKVPRSVFRLNEQFECKAAFGILNQAEAEDMLARELDNPAYLTGFTNQSTFIRIFPDEKICSEILGQYLHHNRVFDRSRRNIDTSFLAMAYNVVGGLGQMTGRDNVLADLGLEDAAGVMSEEDLQNAISNNNVGGLQQACRAIRVTERNFNSFFDPTSQEGRQVYSLMSLFGGTLIIFSVPFWFNQGRNPPRVARDNRMSTPYLILVGFVTRLVHLIASYAARQNIIESTLGQYMMRPISSALGPNTFRLAATVNVINDGIATLLTSTLCMGYARFQGIKYKQEVASIIMKKKSELRTNEDVYKYATEMDKFGFFSTFYENSIDGEDDRKNKLKPEVVPTWREAFAKYVWDESKHKYEFYPEKAKANNYRDYYNEKKPDPIGSRVKDALGRSFGKKQKNFYWDGKDDETRDPRVHFNTFTASEALVPAPPQPAFLQYISRHLHPAMSNYLWYKIFFSVTSLVITYQTIIPILFAQKETGTTFSNANMKSIRPHTKGRAGSSLVFRDMSSV